MIADELVDFDRHGEGNAVDQGVTAPQTVLSSWRAHGSALAQFIDDQREDIPRRVLADEDV